MSTNSLPNTGASIEVPNSFIATSDDSPLCQANAKQGANYVLIQDICDVATKHFNALDSGDDVSVSVAVKGWDFKREENAIMSVVESGQANIKAAMATLEALRKAGVVSSGTDGGKGMRAEDAFQRALVDAGLQADCRYNTRRRNNNGLSAYVDVLVRDHAFAMVVTDTATNHSEPALVCLPGSTVVFELKYVRRNCAGAELEERLRIAQEQAEDEGYLANAPTALLVFGNDLGFAYKVLDIESNHQAIGTRIEKQVRERRNQRNNHYQHDYSPYEKAQALAIKKAFYKKRNQDRRDSGTLYTSHGGYSR
ncbi:MAG: hypothetical protein JRN68_01075 [Nitrososphaerota archaeon]|nr:hypothetical protein [Ferrimicrobium acidiphilum]MDG6933268.1 hypothetical protein [Nitrososphaerota archaeon]